MVDDFEDDVGDEVCHAVTAVGDCGGAVAAVIGRCGGCAEDAVGVDDADGAEDCARDVGYEGLGLRCGAAVVRDEDGKGVAAEGAVGARIVDEAEVVDGRGMPVGGEVARARLVIEGGAAFGESGTDAGGSERCVARHDGAYGHGGKCGVGGEEAVHKRSCRRGRGAVLPGQCGVGVHGGLSMAYAEALRWAVEANDAVDLYGTAVAAEKDVSGVVVAHLEGIVKQGRGTDMEGRLGTARAQGAPRAAVQVGSLDKDGVADDAVEACRAAHGHGLMELDDAGEHERTVGADAVGDARVSDDGHAETGDGVICGQGVAEDARGIDGGGSQGDGKREHDGEMTYHVQEG